MQLLVREIMKATLFIVILLWSQCSLVTSQCTLFVFQSEPLKYTRCNPFDGNGDLNLEMTCRVERLDPSIQDYKLIWVHRTLEGNKESISVEGGAGTIEDVHFPYTGDQYRQSKLGEYWCEIVTRDGMIIGTSNSFTIQHPTSYPTFIQRCNSITGYTYRCASNNRLPVVTSSILLQPSTSSAVEPSTSSAVQSGKSSAVQPSISSAVQPSTSSAVQSGKSSAVQRSISSAVQPSTSFTVETDSTIKNMPTSHITNPPTTIANDTTSIISTNNMMIIIIVTIIPLTTVTITCTSIAIIIAIIILIVKKSRKKIEQTPEENIYYVEPNIFIPPKYQPIDKRTLDYLGLYDVILPSTSTNIEEAIV